jgi:hypothetical protein
MKRYGRSKVSEFLGDMIVYRNLVPIDQRLPSLADSWGQIGLSSSAIPRKTTPEYARVLAYLLGQARQLLDSSLQIERVLFVGDTRLNDGTAFRNICQAGNWSGLAFIAAEQSEPYNYEIDEGPAGTIFHANRWSALEDFITFCEGQNFPVDERTAVLLDLDKTALGARGRNDKVIDQARIEAANQTVSGLLGDEFDPQSFETAYQRLNQPEFHPFTADNQDYLVYICLILGGELIDLEQLVSQVESGKLAAFDQFLNYVEGNADRLPPKLREVHRDVFSRVSQGDPTPFKEFRFNEYLATVASMGSMDDSTPVEELLSKVITITQEVRHAALGWKEAGALLFGLSDKPDEASIPSAELASQGYQAIHQVETDVVGG